MIRRALAMLDVQNRRQPVKAARPHAWGRANGGGWWQILAAQASMAAANCEQ